MRHHLSDARAVHIVILAIPFLVTAIALAGLTHEFPVFQSGDERIHFDIVSQVALQWPSPVLWGYAAWSGPWCTGCWRRSACRSEAIWRRHASS